MVWTRTHWLLLSEIGFFLIIFLCSLGPTEDPDIWFHLKSGEIIASQGIIHHDVFSYTAAGREWFPFEWLFQITVYYLHHLFGFVAIQIMVAGLAVISVALLYRIMRKIIQLPVPPALVTSWLFFVLARDFIVDRPHLLAYTLLLANLYLILLYAEKNIQRLWLTLPLTLLWANLHGSIVLDVLLFAGYTLVTGGQYVLSKEPSWLRKSKTLAIYTGLTTVLTILPPLYLTQYRQLWLFWLNRETVNAFMDEWMPIWRLHLPTAILSAILMLIVFAWSAVNLHRRKKLSGWLWLTPPLAFVFLAFLAARNLFLGYVTLALLFAWNISLNKKMAAAIYAVLVVGSIWLLWQKIQPSPPTLPVAAVSFIEQHHLAGHLWHSWAHGGYLLYRLYPSQQVFYDGRADLYLCCEIKEFLGLANAKNVPDEEYRPILNAFWARHEISFVILPSTPHSLWRKISRILSTDPDWSLVFWDDQAEIYVRHDGKNQATLGDGTAQAATPYQDSLYRPGSERLAQQEYERMIAIADSAHSRNAVGVIYLRTGQMDQAYDQFAQAIEIDPTFESPYLNLGEMAASQGDYQKAIRLYTKAQALAPGRSFISTRLEELKASTH